MKINALFSDLPIEIIKINQREILSEILPKSQKLVPIRYFTIIPRARMGSESIAHEAIAQMGY